jgi:hypothetical protein
VIAVTQQDFVGDELADFVARPMFGTEGQPRFFGNAASASSPTA